MSLDRQMEEPSLLRDFACVSGYYICLLLSLDNDFLRS